MCSTTGLVPEAPHTTTRPICIRPPHPSTGVLSSHVHSVLFTYMCLTCTQVMYEHGSRSDGDVHSHLSVSHCRSGCTLGMGHSMSGRCDPAMARDCRSFPICRPVVSTLPSRFSAIFPQQKYSHNITTPHHHNKQESQTPHHHSSTMAESCKAWPRGQCTWGTRCKRVHHKNLDPAQYENREHQEYSVPNDVNVACPRCLAKMLPVCVQISMSCFPSLTVHSATRKAAVGSTTPVPNAAGSEGKTAIACCLSVRATMT